MPKDLTICVSTDWLSVQVVLPEKVIDNGKGEITLEAKERAIEAICSALPQEVGIYLDGENKEPTQVSFDPWCLEQADFEIE